MSDHPKCPRCGEEATYQTPDGTFWDGSAHYWREALPSRKLSGPSVCSSEAADVFSRAGAEPATGGTVHDGNAIGRTAGSIPATGATPCDSACDFVQPYGFVPEEGCPIHDPPACHCGKDGHALNSINCPIHSSKTIWKEALWDALGDQVKVDRVIALAIERGLLP